MTAHLLRSYQEVLRCEPSHICFREEASAAQNVTAELVARGYSAEEIDAIWGGNFLRVLGQAAAANK